MSRRCLVLVLAACLLAPHVPGQGPPRRTVYSSRCGSEVAWRTSFEDAARDAKKLGRPVFWFVPTAWDTKMDRRQELYWYMMGGAFMDEALIARINESFVPLKLALSPVLRGFDDAKVPPRRQAKELAERYGLVRPKFVEPGIVLLDRKMKAVHTMDRLTTYSSGWMLHRLDRLAELHPAELKTEPRDPRPADPLTAARAALRAGRVPEAKAAFDEARAAATRARAPWMEATYLAGACRHMLRETSAADGLWRELLEAAPDDRWAWKAKLELDGWGPFRRGFEELRDYPAAVLEKDDLRTSRSPGTAAERDRMVGRALAILLALQREHGGWDDSRYDFGGLDSLPNVHVAVSALAAEALLAWRARDPQRIDAALDAAVAYLSDEGRTNPRDHDEIVWAHVYRLHLFARLLAERPKQDAERLRAKIQEIVGRVQKLQQRGGAWRHEYPAPITTASVLHALVVADEAGARIDRGLLASGAKALAGARGRSGTFSYGMRGRAPVQSSAGRMPLCELALSLCGKSSKTKLAAAIESSFEHHGLLEAIRKYDDHADRWGNGGFFFWYDMHARAEAIRRLGGARRRRWMKEVQRIVESIHEADGGWIDSHEVGKTYGTAMALIVLDRSADTTN